MSQLVMEYDTTGTTNSTLNDLFKFNVSNPFYLLAPVYYYNFYASYLMPALALYCGQIGGVHNAGVGFNAQRVLPSISRGLTNLLFANAANGIKIVAIINKGIPTFFFFLNTINIIPASAIINNTK